MNIKRRDEKRGQLDKRVQYSSNTPVHTPVLSKHLYRQKGSNLVLMATL